MPAIMIESAMGKGNFKIADTFYKNVKLQSIKNAYRDVGGYEIASELSAFSREIAFWCGSNEPYPRKSFTINGKSLTSEMTFFRIK